MRDLDCDIGRERQQPFDKDPCLVGTVRAVERYRSPCMNNDRHSVGVCRTKDGLQLIEVIRVLELDVRVAEMQLYPAAQPRIFGTAGDLVERLVLERVKSAKRDQPLWIKGGLCPDPVVLCLDACVFVLGFLTGPAV